MSQHGEQLSAKRILGTQRRELLSMLHVFAKDRVATALRCRCRNRGIVNVDFMRGRKGQCPLVNGQRQRHDSWPCRLWRRRWTLDRRGHWCRRRGVLTPFIGFEPVEREISRQAPTELAKTCEQLAGRGLPLHFKRASASDLNHGPSIWGRQCRFETGARRANCPIWRLSWPNPRKDILDRHACHWPSLAKSYLLRRRWLRFRQKPVHRGLRLRCG